MKFYRNDMGEVIRDEGGRMRERRDKGRRDGKTPEGFPVGS